MAINMWLQEAQEAGTDAVTNADVATDSVAVEVLSSNQISSRLWDPDVWAAFGWGGLKIIVILILTWLTIRLIDKATKRWTLVFESYADTHPRRQRAYTVGTLLSSSARYLLWPLAIIMVLSELKLDVSALIATAGIAGIALGFGAQTLVQDVISGIFLLFDDTIHVGDIISVNGQDGTVEYIGVRLIKVRKITGELLMIPAGEMRIFGNLSIDFMRVIVRIGLAYEQNLEETLPALQRIADEWAAENRDILLEEKPLVQAITELADSSVNVRIMIMVRAGEQFEAERQLRRRVKREFDKLGIEIPFPRRTVYFKQKEDA